MWDQKMLPGLAMRWLAALYVLAVLVSVALRQKQEAPTPPFPCSPLRHDAFPTHPGHSAQTLCVLTLTWFPKSPSY